MKTTYLINSIQPDGSTALVETTAEHWHEITENNKLLPKDERRYFITDIISESGNLDRMIIEASYKEYLRWMVERSPTIRNNSLKKQYTHLSLDAEIANDAIDPRGFEEDVMSRVYLTQLQKALESWNPWAVDFLDCYLKYESRIQQLNEEVAHLEKGLKALDKQIAQYRALKRDSDDLRENRELTAALIDRLIDRIEITKDKQITVRYRFESEFDSNEEVLNRCKNM